MKTWRFHLITLLWAAVIGILTLIPGPDIPEVPFWNIPYFDKLVHFGLFGMLAFLGIRGIYRQKGPSINLKIIAACTSLAVIIYGCLIEYLQSFVPGRSGEFLDILANSLGALAGPLAFLIIQKYY